MALTLSAVEARLISLGLAPVLHRLIMGQLDNPIHLPFAALITAKAVQALLYRWLWFNQEVKSRTSLRLDADRNVLVILPRYGPERRGRRGSK